MSRPKRSGPTSRELVLGRSLSSFMRSLGIGCDSGDVRGEQTRLRNQMKRLFRCSVSLIYEDQRGDASLSSLIADRTESADTLSDVAIPVDKQILRWRVEIGRCCGGSNL